MITTNWKTENRKQKTKTKKNKKKKKKKKKKGYYRLNEIME
jgi:hypothetical protein